MQIKLQSLLFIQMDRTLRTVTIMVITFNTNYIWDQYSVQSMTYSVTMTYKLLYNDAPLNSRCSKNELELTSALTS